MDFKDYINQLGKLDKQEIEVELNNFYTFNSGLFQFFKAIDGQFQSLLNSSNLNAKSIETILVQTNQILPELNNLKFEVSMFEADQLSEFYKNDLTKTIRYIKEAMVISEVEITKQRFLKILSDNETKYKEEHFEKERIKLSEIEEQKRIEHEMQEKLRKEEERIEKERLEKLSIEKEEKERIKKEEAQKKRVEEERKERERLKKIELEIEIKEKLKLDEERREREMLDRIQKENEEKEHNRIAELRKELQINKSQIQAVKNKFGIRKVGAILNGKQLTVIEVGAQIWLYHHTGNINANFLSKYSLEKLKTIEFGDFRIPNLEDWQIMAEILRNAPILLGFDYLYLENNIKYWTLNEENNQDKNNYFAVSFNKDNLSLEISIIDNEKQECHLRLIKNQK